MTELAGIQNLVSQAQSQANVGQQAPVVAEKKVTAQEGLDDSAVAASMQAIKNAAGNPSTPPSTQDISKLLSARPELVTPELKAAASAASTPVAPQSPIQKTAEQLKVQALLDEHLAKKEDHDPFAATIKIISSIFSPAVNKIKDFVEKLTGIGRESVEAAVDRGFGHLQSKNVAIRNSVTDLSRSFASAFNGLAEASDKGDLDIQTQKIAMGVKKAIQEAPGAFKAIMENFPKEQMMIVQNALDHAHTQLHNLSALKQLQQSPSALTLEAQSQPIATTQPLGGIS